MKDQQMWRSNRGINIHNFEKLKTVEKLTQ